MRVLDALFVALFAVAFPLLAARSFPRVMRRIAEWQAGARVAAYRETLLREWALALGGAGLWLVGGRTLADLGFRSPSGAGFWIALALAALVATAAARPLFAASRSEAERHEVRAGLGGPLVLLPRAPHEERAFAALSFSAGICEETLYRGWCIGWLAPLVGTAAAAILSTVAFGAAHLYAGGPVALRATAMGAVLGALFVLSGSLWVPILLHATMDLILGRTAVVAFRDVRAPEGTAAAPAP
jgi:membrane protease YdiL (CAAX protease family)